MQQEKLKKQNNQRQATKEGYIIIPNYFLREWVKVLGIGPALLYLQLLSYCHKEKDIAWPTLATLSSKLGISKNSLLSYRKTLLRYGLIKQIIKRRTAQGNYQSNFYKVTPMEGSAKIELRQVHILGGGGANIAPGVVQNLHPNNTNLNITNLTAAKGEKDAVAAVVNFKKLKEKGEEKMRAVRERMADLNFKEEFMEKILKEYSTKKIEEKLNLLMERRNIKNPAGWLRAALKNDYRGEEPGEEDERESQPRMDSRFRGNGIKGSGNGNSQGEGDKILSTEEVRERFKLLRENLMAMNSP